ncbi:hypothetical protein I4U23_019903 [Adineta vaga]|nr:hypothetical protein I4U23_019903 [Adineta vaga]
MTGRLFNKYRTRNRILIIVTTSLSLVLLSLISSLLYHALKKTEANSESTVQSSTKPTTPTAQSTDTSFMIRPTESSLRICPTTTWSNDNGGSALNQLAVPNDIFVDKNDAIYIADSHNHRIIKWDKDAKEGYVVAGSSEQGNQSHELNYQITIIIEFKNGTTIIGKSGHRKSLEQIDNCWGLYVDKNFNVYVSEHSNHRVTKWSPGAKIGKMVAEVDKPIGIHVDESNDDLYVASYHDNSICQFNKFGELIRTIGNDVLDSLYEFVIVPDSNPAHRTIIIVDSEHHRIVKMNMTNPDQYTTIAGVTNQPGASAEELNEPRRVLFDSEGNLLVLDSNNNRVQKFLIENNNCNT